MAGAGGSSGNTYMPASGFGCGSGEYVFAIGGENGKTVSAKQHFDTSVGGSYYESYACFNFGTYEDDYVRWQKRLWDYEVHSASDVSNRIWSGGIGGGGTVGTRYEDRWFNIPDCAQAGKGRNHNL